MRSVIHKADSRGLADYGWLKSRHSFSFASYHNPERVRFGLLRVLNDDIVQPGEGFGTHPHDNMEIISIPLKGALAHKDSTGNEHIINTGDVQIMSAGSGLYHSEYNASKKELVNFLQIWVFPKLKDIEPRYDQKTFGATDRVNKFMTVVSPERSADTLWINQDAYFSLGTIEAGKSVRYDIKNSGNGLYIFVIEGSINAEDIFLGRRDAAGLEDITSVSFTSDKDAEVLLIEVPMKNKDQLK